MKERLAQDYLRDMVDACLCSREFVQGASFDAFRADKKTAFAVIRALEIIGEAAKMVPPDWKRRFRAIPWKSLAGMRDKLIHGYFGVSLDIVWATVTVDLPSVEPLLREMLEVVLAEEAAVISADRKRSLDAEE